MYQENGGGFDRSSSSIHGADAFSQTHLPNCNNFSMEEQSYPQNDVTAAAVAAASALEMELQHQLEIEQCYGGEIQEMANDSSNWQEITNLAGENGQYHHHQNSAADFYAATASMADAAYPTTPDLLNIFPLPRCSPSSLLPNFSHKSPAFLASLGLLQGDVNNPSVDGSAASSGVVYDPVLPLNLLPQPPLLRELFHSLPHGRGVYASRNGGGLLTSSGGVDEREAANVGLYQNGDGVYEFTAAEIGNNRDGIKDTKHFATERHRRVLLNDKYQALRSLVPSPNKKDRASIVGDAIDYINELKRTVSELQGLVEKKRCARERLKRPKVEVEENGMDGSSSSSLQLRSSWLHRKTKNTEVDVRIVHDEVTVKLVQQKRINCLFSVSKLLDELQLDLHHVAGGLIGDFYTYLFNSKICEGSIVYASAVANKLIEVVDKQYAALSSSRL